MSLFISGIRGYVRAVLLDDFYDFVNDLNGAK